MLHSPVPMDQTKLQIEHTLPSSLGEAHVMIRDLLRLNENAEKRQIDIENHFKTQLNRMKLLFRIAVTRIYGSSSEASKALFNESESLASEASIPKEPIPEEDCTSPFCSEDDVNEPNDRPAESEKEKPKTRKRGPIPAHLTRVDVIHDLSAEGMSCANDGSALVKVGEDVREELVFIHSKIIVHRHITPKYGCPKCHCGIQTAPQPKRILPGTMASPSILANIMTSKYCDHLPLYRQEEIFMRHQIEINRATMASWMIKGAQALMPLVNLIRDDVLDAPMIQCDETPLNILEKDFIHISQKSYMWVMGRYGPDRKAVVYELGPKRSGDVAQRLLGDYGGYLQTDGLKSYDQLLASVTGKRLGCMAHVRRKFVDLLKSLPKEKRSDHPAAEIVKQIGKLYRVEEWLRENPNEDFAKHRTEVRQKDCVPLFSELEELISRAITGQSEVSPFGTALKYAETELPKIRLYLTHGECEIDNNWIENMIRPFALGRKNWLFSATIKGADASANIYTIVQTAKHNGLNVHSYLESVFERLPYCETLEDYQALLPWTWRH